MSKNLCNMYNGDGRNNSIFSHLCTVRKTYPKLDEKLEKIGGFANTMFAEPLDDRELANTIKSVLSRNIDVKQKEFKPLEIISAIDLKNKEIQPIQFIVDNMLPQGLALICSPPKYGKSWLMLDLCISVASGNRFLNHNTNQCGCLYLALEDSEARLKDRMNKVLKNAIPPPQFYFSIRSDFLSNNLLQQLDYHISVHNNTKLIVIDTLQKIRGNSANSDTAYGNDYKDLGKLKSFADDKGICILLVHHLRKMKDTR